MTIRYLGVFAGLLMLLTTGCVNIDYVGGSFPPDNSGKQVTFYGNRQAMPLDKYRIIGRAKVSAPAKYSGYELRERLLEYAVERGADAVCVVDRKVVDLGIYPQDNSDFPGRETGQKKSSAAADIFGNDYWSPKPVGRLGSAQRRREVKLQVLFLVDSKRLDKLMAESSAKNQENYNNE